MPTTITARTSEFAGPFWSKNDPIRRGAKQTATWGFAFALIAIVMLAGAGVPLFSNEPVSAAAIDAPFVPLISP